MRGAKILPLPSFANAVARRWPPNAIGRAAAEEQFSKASILAQKPTAARKREREREIDWRGRAGAHRVAAEEQAIKLMMVGSVLQ